MSNIEYLFKYNNLPNKFKYRLVNKMIICDIKTKALDSSAIHQMLFYVSTIKNKKLSKLLPLVFNFTTPKIKCADKLTYIILECICYNLINDGYNVRISIDCKSDIWTDGINASPLVLLRFNQKNCNNKNILKDYIKKFNFDIYGKHFRKIITAKSRNKIEYDAVLLDDLSHFIGNCGIEDQKDAVALVMSELAGNAGEHTSSDCLIDVDISNEYYKSDNINSNELYHSINITILNFSNKLLGSDIKEKLQLNNKFTDRYEKLINAYNFHKKLFNDNYTEEDFYNIAVFQNKISGRKEYNNSGGTGLTTLIKSIQEKSDSNDCYVLSGNRGIYFIKEYLSYDDGWIGFNENNNFFTDVPHCDILTQCPVYIPGTAYNLNFVLRCENYEK